MRVVSSEYEQMDCGDELVELTISRSDRAGEGYHVHVRVIGCNSRTLPPISPHAGPLSREEAWLVGRMAAIEIAADIAAAALEIELSEALRRLLVDRPVVWAPTRETDHAG